MNSVEQRFKRIQNKNPNYGSYLCFAEAIKGRNYSKRVISHWFKLLVGKGDYLPREKKAILRFLRKL